MSDRNNPVSLEHQLLLTLRFYAANTFQIIDGDSFGVHQTSACRIVHRVSDVIARSSHRYVKLPLQQEFQDISLDFYHKSAFPGIVGVLDGTHIKIQAPSGPYSELYRNRKDYFSINAQIMCDADLRIRNLVTRWYGTRFFQRIYTQFSTNLLCEYSVNRCLLESICLAIQATGARVACSLRFFTLRIMRRKHIITVTGELATQSNVA